MIETTISNDLVYLYVLHLEYLQIFENNADYEYKPIFILLDKKTKLYTLTVDLISNQQIDNNDSTGNSEFSRRTPRLPEMG